MYKDKVCFSIIIPVYNVEKYLKKCVESIIQQVYTNYEVILVDDGSQDSSGEMCDLIANKYKNFKVIHQINGGLSKARNAGLRDAKGDYIVFLDSDDYLEQNTLQVLNEAIKNIHPDIVAGYGYKFSSDGKIEPGMPYRDIEDILTGKDFYSRALYQGKLSAGAPYYIYRTVFLKRNDFKFVPNLLHEDELWTPVVLYNAEKVLDLKYRYYYYRCDNTESITRNPLQEQRRALDRLEISKKLAYYFKDKRNKKCFSDNISAQYMYAVYAGKLAGNKEVSRFFPIRHAKTYKYIFKAVIFMISPRLACRLRGKVKK